MTQFETSLKNMCANLDAEQQSFETEKWEEIRATEIAEFRQKQERICQEGIDALQRQRDIAISEHETALRKELKERANRKFGTARQKLEETMRLFEESAEE